LSTIRLLFPLSLLDLRRLRDVVCTIRLWFPVSQLDLLRLRDVVCFVDVVVGDDGTHMTVTLPLASEDMMSVSEWRCCWLPLLPPLPPPPLPPPPPPPPPTAS
jgi:hypothetical protein